MGARAVHQQAAGRADIGKGTAGAGVADLRCCSKLVLRAARVGILTADGAHHAAVACPLLGISQVRDSICRQSRAGPGQAWGWKAGPAKTGGELLGRRACLPAGPPAQHGLGSCRARVT